MSNSTIDPLTNSVTNSVAGGSVNSIVNAPIDVILKISDIIAENVIDLDVRLLDSFDGVGTNWVNYEGDATYDADIGALTTSGTLGTGSARINLGSVDPVRLDNNGTSAPFINNLHKNSGGDYYFGFKYESGTVNGSNLFLDAASGVGLELIMASDGRTKSKRRTSSGNEEITTSSSPSLTTETAYELFYTRRASDGSFRVFINGTQVDSTIAYTITEEVDADLGNPFLFVELTDSGWTGTAVCAGSKFISSTDVTAISTEWSNRDA